MAAKMLEQSLEIFNKLKAEPCIGLVNMSLSAIQSLRGREENAEALLQNSMKTFENLGAMPDLCECYTAIARFKLHSHEMLRPNFTYQRQRR